MFPFNILFALIGYLSIHAYFIYIIKNLGTEL